MDMYPSEAYVRDVEAAYFGRPQAGVGQEAHEEPVDGQLLVEDRCEGFDFGVVEELRLELHLAHRLGRW